MDGNTEWTTAPAKFTWTPENTEKVTRLWNEGHSATTCARMIGGTTRNAVISKVSRLKLVKRRVTERVQRPKTYLYSDKPCVERQRVRREKKREADAMHARDNRTPPFHGVVPLPPLAFDPGSGKPLIELEANDCRWPLGPLMQPSSEFCGHEKVPGSSYCEHHHERAHARVSTPAGNPNFRYLVTDRIGRLEFMRRHVTEAA